MSVERAHPPSDISLDRLAVTTHRLAPSSPLVKIERNGEASTFQAEGVLGLQSDCNGGRRHGWFLLVDG
jgi:hypothetical protein